MSPSRGIETSGAKPQILIVEDEGIVALYLSRNLAELGYDVAAVASSGEEALEKVRECRVDLALMDIRLKGTLDGIDTAAQLKSHDIPVIYLTAYVDKATLARAKATMPYGYIVKPFDVPDLHATVEMALHRRQTDAALRDTRDRFASAFNNASIGMALVDMNGSWLEVNDALCRIVGYDQPALRAKSLRSITHHEDVDLDGRSLRQLVDGRMPSYQIEKRWRHASGHYVWILLTVSLVRDENGQALYFITQAQDISDAKDQGRRLEYLVSHDFLTGLYNRRHFEQELSNEVDRTIRYGGEGAVLLIDLDHFKDINDSFGHRAGDDLLKGVAARLKHRLRQTDVLARLGGDEFGVLLPETDVTQALRVAQDIVAALRQPIVEVADRTVGVTASVGVVVLGGLTGAEVLARADIAMYDAKDIGGNHFCLYGSATSPQTRVSRRLGKAEYIRRTLAEGRLQLFCQPIIRLKDRQTSQYELLVRLPNEDGEGSSPAGAFLYIAERAGLIQAIDAWVVRRAIALITEHARVGHRLSVNVNISGKSIGDPAFASSTEETLVEAGIDPSCLVFEVTETTAINNIDQARVFARRMHAKGCRFALDDFGAGFGSFAYLKNFPFDVLKIDGQFIRDLVTNPTDQLVVRAIVNIAKELGKETVAEFVADAECAHLLDEIGVGYGQGYYIGRPRPIEGLLDLSTT